MSRLRDAWYLFDRLTDVKKVAVGSAMVLFLFSSWLYCLGFVGLVTAGRQPAGVAAAAGGTATPAATVALPAGPTVFVPASLPTERPLATPVPTFQPAPAAPPPATRIPTSVPAAATSTRVPVVTPTPTRGTPPAATQTRVPATPTVPLLITPGLPPTATRGATQPAATATRVPTAPSPTPGGR